MTFKFEYAEGTFTSLSPNSHKERGFGSRTKEVLLSLPCPPDKEKLREVKKGNISGWQGGVNIIFTCSFKFWEESLDR